MSDRWAGKMEIFPPGGSDRSELVEPLRQMLDVPRPGATFGSVTVARIRVSAIRRYVEAVTDLARSRGELERAMGDLHDARLYRQRMANLLRDAEDIHKKDELERKTARLDAEERHAEAMLKAQIRKMQREIELEDAKALYEERMRGSRSRPQGTAATQASMEDKKDLCLEIQTDINGILRGRSEGELAADEKFLLVRLRAYQQEFCRS